jgi:hypothetical protein
VAGVSSRPEQPPRGVPIAQQAQPKVIPLPAVTPSPQEINNSKDSERSKEDSTTVVINDRKVSLCFLNFFLEHLRCVNANTLAR